MKIYALDLLSGKTPDPYYKNLFWFPDVCDPSSATPLPSQTRTAIESIEGVTKTTIQLLSTLEPDKTVYAIAETPTVCSLTIARSEIRSISELSDMAKYIIIHELQANGATRTFSFWFVMNISILSEGKFRVDLQRDEWASNWSVYINTPIQFTRRHTPRWRRLTPGVDSFAPIFNGLSDPVAESMVMSKTHDEPAPVFGSSYVNIQGVGYVHAVMLWRYIRFNTTHFYHKEGTTYQGIGSPAAVELPQNIPSCAYPLGLIYRADDTSKTYFRPFQKVHDGTTNHDISFTVVVGYTSPYIVDSFVTTRPPRPFTWDFLTVGGNTYLRAKPVMTEDTTAPIVYDDNYVVYGTFPPTDDYKLPGGMVYRVSTSNGSSTRESFADSFTFSQIAETYPQTETKIFEAPYSANVLKIGSAHIDISPAPGRETVTVEIPCKLGTSIIIKGDGKEIAEVPGWWAGMQIDTMNSAIEDWLIANRNTYEMGKNLQVVNTLTGVVKGIATKNYGGAAASMMAGVEEAARGEARIKDLTNTPNSTTLPTANGFDNLPFVDHPLIAVTETIDEAKQKILKFWKRYGYPDNSTAAMKDSITRDEVVYMQGTPTVPTPGIIPPRQSWFVSAVSSGVYLWRIHNTLGVLTTTYGETLDPADILNRDEV